MRVITFLFLLLVLATSPVTAETSRIMLKPPDKMPSTRIGGKNYVNGEVYLSKKADPAMLTPLGFREVRFIAGATHYNRYYAFWPRETVLDSLPPEIVGITYDFVPPPENTVFVFSKTMGPKTTRSCYCSNTTTKGPDGFCYRKYVQAFPIEPDTTINDKPYVQGKVYLDNESELEKLRQLGFVCLRETKLSRLHDPLIEDYVSDPAYYQSRPQYSPYTAYSAFWPMDLNIHSLPHSVINMISDYETATAGVKRPRPKTTILQY